MIGIIVAIDAQFGIGKNNKIPWHIPADLKRFKAITTNSAVIMGRKTWESIGSKPLKNRQNIIVSKTLSSDILSDSVFLAQDVESALRQVEMPHTFFIGGYQIYLEGLKYADTVFLTCVNADFECDTFFPMKEMEKDFRFHNSVLPPQEGEKISYDFLEFVRKDEKGKLRSF